MAEETITAQTPEIDPGMSVVPEAPGLMDVPTVIPELGLAAQALASQVSFAKKTWKDGSGGGTPVTAAELNRLEQGVADLTAAVNGLQDSVSHTTLGYFHDSQINFNLKSLGLAAGVYFMVGKGNYESDKYLGLMEYIGKKVFLTKLTGSAYDISVSETTVTVARCPYYTSWYAVKIC